MFNHQATAFIRKITPQYKRIPLKVKDRREKKAVPG